MSGVKLLCHLANVNICLLSKEENLVLEADLFSRLCQELKETYRIQYKGYFRILRLNIEMENIIMETNFVRCIINDILSTDEYTLSGIAYYTYVPEDVIFEIASGRNTDPSASLLRKIIELHRSVRPALYKGIINKIINESGI